MSSIVKKIYRGLRKLLIGRPSKRLYKFMINDWVRLTDLDMCSKVLDTKRFIRNLRPLEMEHPAAKRILVIAPHPDDDILGAGGTLLKAIDSGAKVHVLYVTNGLSEQTDAIRQETLQVCESTGMIPHFLDCRSRAIPLDNLRINSEFLALLKYIAPEAIFISFLLDDHDDHRRVNHLMHNILQNQAASQAEIWAYQIYSSIIPNVVVNITEQVEKKRELIHLWKSVVKFNDLAHYILGINASNCRFLPANEPVYVEAFFVVPLMEYLNLCSIYFGGNSSEIYYYDYYRARS